MKRLLGLLGVSFGLMACAPTYKLTNLQMQSIDAYPKVTVQPVNEMQSPFQRLRFVVKVYNHTSQNLPFSTDSVKAKLNGRGARVLSYEAQRQELESIILYYQPLVRFNPRELVTYGRLGQPLGVAYQPVGFDIPMDSIDLQNALNELAYLKSHAVRPVLIKPGETYQGEITLLDKLDQSAEQKIDLQITFAGQTHQFIVNAQRVVN